MRRLLKGALPKTADAPPTLLDPFVGSGTTLVEGVRLGLRTFGTDINPLGVALTRLKATPTTPQERADLLRFAALAGERSLDRVARRARTRSSGEELDDPTFYAPHVFRELVGLHQEIVALGQSAPREALLLVLTSVVVKVSRQRADTSSELVERSIAKGLPTRLFVRRAEELIKQLALFAESAPLDGPAPDVRLGDARQLAHIAGGSIDLVITSPPYLGTYDYVAQHARRLGWLGADGARFAEREIGARRHSVSPEAARAQWRGEIGQCIAELARVLAPTGLAFIVIGDSLVKGEGIAGDIAIHKAAERSKLAVWASAHQERPQFGPRDVPVAETRHEHLLVLGHAGNPPRAPFLGRPKVGAPMGRRAHPAPRRGVIRSARVANQGRESGCRRHHDEVPRYQRT